MRQEVGPYDGSSGSVIDHLSSSASQLSRCCLSSTPLATSLLPSPKVGPYDGSLGSVRDHLSSSASRRRRRHARNRQRKIRAAERKRSRILQLQSEPLPGVALGTRLILRASMIPRVPKLLWETISTHGDGVRVEKAPRCGYALKADRDFPKGSYITQYEGALLTREEAMALPPYKRTHLFGIGGRAGCIDGLKTPLLGRGAASFANHLGRGFNAILYKGLFGVFLRAKVSIRKGQWITTSYGSQFIKSKLGRCTHPGVQHAR
jgi:hypothetical protein